MFHRFSTWWRALSVVLLCLATMAWPTAARAGTSPTFALLHQDAVATITAKGTAHFAFTLSTSPAGTSSSARGRRSIPASSTAPNSPQSSPTPARPKNHWARPALLPSNARPTATTSSPSTSLQSDRARHGGPVRRRPACTSPAPRCTVTASIPCASKSRRTRRRRSSGRSSRWSPPRSSNRCGSTSSRRWTPTRGCTPNAPSPCCISSRTTPRRRSR